MRQEFDGQIGRQRFESERPRGTQAVIVHFPSKTTVGTSATTLYTVPDNKFFLIEEVTVTNVRSSGTEVFDLNMVPSGGSAGTDNAVIYQEQINAKTSLRLATLSGLMLDPKATFQAKTTNSAGINVTFWGVEVAGI